jgi:hypothetical protein
LGRLRTAILPALSLCHDKRTAARSITNGD